MLSNLFSSKLKSPLRCFASINSIELADAVKSLKYEPPELSVSFIVPELLAASDLLRNQFLDDLPTSLGDRTPHFVIVGFQKQGQAIVRTIAELVHLENEKRCRLTILYENEQDRIEFMNRFPAFCQEQTAEMDPWDLPREADDWNCKTVHAKKHLRFPESEPGISFVCNARFEQLPAHGLNDRNVQKIGSLLSIEHCLPLVIVCQDDDATNLRTAQMLTEKLQATTELPQNHPWTRSHRESQPGLPVYVQLWEHDGLHQALTSPPMWAKNGVRPVCKTVPFGRALNVLNHDSITGDDTVQLAYRIFAAYELFYSDPTKNWEQIDWDRLVEFDQTLSTQSKKQITWDAWTSSTFYSQYSNIQAALHAPFKSRILNPVLTMSGLTSGIGKKVQISIDRKIFLHLGRVEHNRWTGERLMSGWRYAEKREGEPKEATDSRRERHQLVSCDDMKETLQAEFDNEFFKDLMQYQCLLKHYGIECRLAAELKDHVARIIERQTSSDQPPGEMPSGMPGLGSGGEAIV